MIFRDRVHVILTEEREEFGTVEFVTVFDGLVAGTVTFLDSSNTVSAEATTVRSRLQIFLSPFAEQISPDLGSRLIMSWGPFSNFTPDGAVEPHYLNSRLHHYELIASVV